MDRLRSLDGMPERLDLVRIALKSRDVTITWDDREALVHRLDRINSTYGIRASFAAVGATRPVDLDGRQCAALLSFLEDWMQVAGAEAMPHGLYHLRNALIEELHPGG